MASSIISVALLSFFLVSLVAGEECGEYVFCPDDAIFFNYTGEVPISVRIFRKEDFILDDYFFKTRGLHRALKIEIIETKITSISPLAFAGLEDLYLVSLVDNGLTTFPNDVFVNNPQLRKLTIQKNPDLQVSNIIVKNDGLDELIFNDCSLGGKLTSQSFNGVPSLSFLNISGNHIEELPDFVFDELGELETLDISRNELTRILPGLFVNLTLADLYLSKNPLSDVKGIVSTELIKFDLSYCKLETIDEQTFEGFPNLMDLNLKFNRIQNVSPKAFANLHDLQNLDMSDNHLNKRLPNNLFAYNVALETLRLAGNLDLKEFGSFDAPMDHLYLLDISGCGIEKLVELKRFPSVARLLLANNSLDSIPEGVINPHVKVLDLSGNKFDRIDRIKFPRQSFLTQLLLDRNPLESVNPSVLARTSIRLLSLSDCELRKLWTERNAILKNINHLVITNNHIKSLSEKDIEILPGLNSIEISGNPLECDIDFKNFITYIETHMPEESKLFLKDICGVYSEIEIDDIQANNRDILVNRLGDLNVEEESEEQYNEITGAYIGETYSYIWPVLLAAIVTFICVLSMAMIVFILLRYMRQRQIPQRIMIGNRPSYHPLREEMNIPTTPVSTRIDIKGVYPNETYKSTTYHHSKITPTS